MSALVQLFVRRREHVVAIYSSFDGDEGHVRIGEGYRAGVT